MARRFRWPTDSKSKPAQDWLLGIRIPVRITAEYAGTVKFQNVEEGVTVAKQIDEVTGLSTLVVIDPKRGGKAQTKGLRPQVKLFDASGEEVRMHGSDHAVTITFQVGAIITV